MNNTYVYFIETIQKSKYNVTQFTLSVNVTKRPDAPVIGGINITYDFWDWYENNKANIPFYAPPIIKKDSLDDREDYFTDPQD